MSTKKSKAYAATNVAAEKSMGETMKLLTARKATGLQWTAGNEP